MYLQPDFITMEATIAEIVAKDYRTAAVFSRYGIGYCCGGNKQLGVICHINGCDPTLLLRDLRAAVQEFRFPSRAEVSRWSIDFLIDYIINVHHYYLKYMLPQYKTELERFIDGHGAKFPGMLNLMPQL